MFLCSQLINLAHYIILPLYTGASQAAIRGVGGGGLGCLGGAGFGDRGFGCLEGWGCLGEVFGGSGSWGFDVHGVQCLGG